MDNKQHYIYVYIRKDTNDVCYIGKGVNNRDKKISQHNAYCQRIAQKYGIEIKRIKENLSKDEANIAEQEIIIHYVKDLHYSICIKGFYDKDNKHQLCNQTWGGEGMWGFIPNEETRQKIRASKLGEKNPAKREDVRKKLSDNHRFHNATEIEKQKQKTIEYFNSVDGEKHRKEASVRAKQFYQTSKGKEAKEKMRKSLIEYYQTDKGKLQLQYAFEKSQEFWNNVDKVAYGKIISQRMKDYWKSEKGQEVIQKKKEKITGFNSHSSKNIRCIESNQIFANVRELAENIDMKPDNLYAKFRRSNGKPIEIIINDKSLHFVRILK